MGSERALCLASRPAEQMQGQDTEIEEDGAVDQVFHVLSIFFLNYSDLLSTCF